MDIQHATNWFKNYVKNYYTTDLDIQHHILLKEKHTSHVVENALLISKNLKLTAKDAELAQFIALFHDLGRFKQYTIYHTFMDAKSEDHATLSLKELNLYEPYLEFSDELKSYIDFAIINHNKKILPEGQSGKHYLLAHLVRDADKLDIYRVLDGLPKEDKGMYTQSIVEDIKNRRQTDYGQMITAHDRRLVRLCWLYDVYYEYTLQKIVQGGYIQRIYQLLPQDMVMDEVKHNINNYLKERLQHIEFEKRGYKYGEN